jgi:glutamate-ammonia-ligase adenylyltransferase
MLHVLWREIFALANLDETLNSLSSLADRLLDAASRYSSKVLAARYGTVRTADGSEVPPVILGMGKLGGYELNFSSDVDIIFLYPEAGETDGARRISAQEYFGSSFFVWTRVCARSATAAHPLSASGRSSPTSCNMGVTGSAMPM